MNKYLYIFICFLGGILIYNLIKSYYNCNILEGLKNNCNCKNLCINGEKKNPNQSDPGCRTPGSVTLSNFCRNCTPVPVKSTGVQFVTGISKEKKSSKEPSATGCPLTDNEVDDVKNSIIGLKHTLSPQFNISNNLELDENKHLKGLSYRNSCCQGVYFLLYEGPVNMLNNHYCNLQRADDQQKNAENKTRTPSWNNMKDIYNDICLTDETLKIITPTCPDLNMFG